MNMGDVFMCLLCAYAGSLPFQACAAFLKFSGSVNQKKAKGWDGNPGSMLRAASVAAAVCVALAALAALFKFKGW